MITKRTLASLVIFFAVALSSRMALARPVMDFTGSVAASNSSIPYQAYDSRYISASIGVDLGSQLRLSYSYSQEESFTKGYTDIRSESDLTLANATRAEANDDPDDDNNLVTYSSHSRVIGNSIDLQLVLYEGEIFSPYITGGVIKKMTTIDMEKDGDLTKGKPVPGLGPNLGVGLGIRLNREFMLKLSYIASQGATREPFEPKAKTTWDRKATVGLSYKL